MVASTVCGDRQVRGYAIEAREQPPLFGNRPRPVWSLPGNSSPPLRPSTTTPSTSTPPLPAAYQLPRRLIAQRLVEPGRRCVLAVCRLLVSAVYYRDGTSCTDPPATRSSGAGQRRFAEHPGKIVDLDPEQQNVSEIWGFQVELGKPGSGLGFSSASRSPRSPTSGSVAAPRPSPHRRDRPFTRASSSRSDWTGSRGVAVPQGAVRGRHRPTA